MQVMTVGQRVSFEYCGTNYIFTVNQAVVEGREDSKSIERGMVSTETYFVFETSPSSGIKVLFLFWCYFTWLFVLLIFPILIALFYWPTFNSFAIVIHFHFEMAY